MAQAIRDIRPFVGNPCRNNPQSRTAPKATKPKYSQFRSTHRPSSSKSSTFPRNAENRIPHLLGMVTVLPHFTVRSTGLGIPVRLAANETETTKNPPGPWRYFRWHGPASLERQRYREQQWRAFPAQGEVRSSSGAGSFYPAVSAGVRDDWRMDIPAGGGKKHRNSKLPRSDRQHRYVRIACPVRGQPSPIRFQAHRIGSDRSGCASPEFAPWYPTAR